MPASSPPRDERDRPEDSPIAWFGEMLLAIERRDFRRATEAQHQLRRLGWSVLQSKSRPRPYTGRHEADGRGGGPMSHPHSREAATRPEPRPRLAAASIEPMLSR